MLLNPLCKTFISSPLRELVWFGAEGFEDGDMLPRVVVIVIKQPLTLLVFQMQLISRFHAYIRSEDYVVRVRMDLLVHLWVCKVLWVRNVLGDVGNETHVFDIILDEVVVLSAVLTSL